jgi:uncharacterized membrane protein YeaQ/YmgE (transglycosylase-associated protein family)
MEILILILHVFCGAAGLVIGLGAFASKKRKGMHTFLGNIYHWLFLTLSLSAITLSLLNWERLWWFLPIAFFSYAFSLVGFLAAKIKWRNWIRFHLTGQAGSFIAMITAVLVVNFGSDNIFIWFLPSIIGTPIIIWLARQIKAGKIAKHV